LTDGIDSRLRGRLLHSLCESLWRELSGQVQLHAMTSAQRASCIERHWQAALADVGTQVRDRVDARVLERERLRSTQLVTRLLELEAARAPFRIAALEQELNIDWAGATLRMRVDRVDELADGSRLLIDYKSGRADSMQLDAPQPRPLQLAAYAAALAAQGAAVQGVALLSLHPAALGFSGRSQEQEGAPRGVKSLPDWGPQTAHWREVVEQLLRAHLDGDARVQPAPGACRYCHLPTLCRIQPGQERVEDPAAPGEDADDE
jgi:RecB family exonuclease